MKPILVIFTPNDEANKEAFDVLSNHEELKNDYHLIFVKDPVQELISFQVFNAEGLEPSSVEEIKEYIDKKNKEHDNKQTTN